MSSNVINNNTAQPEYLRNTNTNENESNIRLRNPSIREYFQKEEEIKHDGYIDERKLRENIRILAFNPNGCNPNDRVKMNHLKKAIEKYQIDIVMMNETNTKWDTVNVSKMERNIKRISRGAQIIAADSKQ